MPWQPDPFLIADAEQWAVTYLSGAWDENAEIQPTFVGDGDPVALSATPDYLVTIRRDGGPSNGLFDNPRLRITASAPTRAEAGDLAAEVTALMFDAPGNGICVAMRHLSGPMDAPKSSTGFPRFYSLIQPRLRCGLLAPEETP